MPPQKIVDKIRKLRALANPSANTSPAEQSSANNLANQLADKYSINESESSPIDNPNTGSSFHKIVKPSSWVILLAKSLALHFDCQYVEKMEKHGGGHKFSIIFYGQSAQAKNAGYAFDSLYNQIQVLSNNYKVIRKQYYGFKSHKAYTITARREFREGLAQGFWNYCQKLTNTQQAGLVIHSESLADSWLADNNLEVIEKSTKKRKTCTRENHFEVGVEMSKNLVIIEKALE